jgi:hypothetical protein
MRYILNDEGYIETVSFNYQVECNNKSCTDYTGSVPTGYETLAEWSENANINAYKIVDGNLTYDSNKDAELQALWESQRKAKIIESGSNANGSWLKFEDGTLIQSMYKTLAAGSGVATSAYGSLYLGSYTWTFPVEFAETEVPRVHCGLFKWSNGASWGTTVEPAYTNVALRGLDVVARNVDAKVSISAIAIGKWK